MVVKCTSKPTYLMVEVSGTSNQSLVVACQKQHTLALESSKYIHLQCYHMEFNKSNWAILLLSVNQYQRIPATTSQPQVPTYSLAGS